MMPQIVCMSMEFQMILIREKSVVINLIISDIFRPFPGFQCIRLIRKTANNNR
jgi:hypothetical protein